MDEKMLKEKLENIRLNMRWIESIIYKDFKTGDGKISSKQIEIVEKLFEIFKALNWQLSFNTYKELKHDGSAPFNQYGCGTPVKIRPCGDEYKKTYFGVLLGDVALSVSHSIDKNDVVSSSFSQYNPAIFVPELKKIIYGCESWWGEIETKEDLDNLITDETIKNVWYVQALTNMGK